MLDYSFLNRDDTIYFCCPNYYELSMWVFIIKKTDTNEVKTGLVLTPHLSL